MIRKLTIAYVTAMVNNYEVKINKVPTETVVTRVLKDVVANLGSLTDYVADLQEDVQADKEYTDNYSIYVRRIQELETELAETEESLTNMMDNEKRLNKRVREAELATKTFEAVTDAVVTENAKLRASIKQTETDLLAMEENKRKTFRNYQKSFEDVNMCNRELKATNTIWQKSCSDLKDELAKLRGPQWIQR